VTLLAVSVGMLVLRFPGVVHGLTGLTGLGVPVDLRLVLFQVARLSCEVGALLLAVRPAWDGGVVGGWALSLVDDMCKDRVLKDHVEVGQRWVSGGLMVVAMSDWVSVGCLVWTG
jgi:hypothetical protein